MISINRLAFKIKHSLFRSRVKMIYKNALAFEKIAIQEKKQLLFLSKKRLINDAYYNTEFYRNFYDTNGFHPDMFVKESDWSLVPVLEKQMIRQNTDNMLSNGTSIMEMRSATTGGSTGKPLKVYKDKSVPVEILSWRSLRWWGLSPYDNHGIVNRSVITKKWQKFLNMLIWWPTKRIFLNASSVTEKNLSDFVNLLEKKKIKFLVGYCGSLEKIADYILENNIKIKSTELVWSTTSPLTDSVRKKIEKAFSCKVMDQYGSIEVFHIAVQKPNENFLTVNDDYVHVDIVNSLNESLNETGEMGDVLVTDLHSFKFPIIKYRLGDRSRVLQPMENSSDGFTKIDFVKGRISDRISFQDGSYLDGAFLTTICDGYEDVIDSYQVYQDKSFKIWFKLVLVNSISSENVRVQIVINNFTNLVNKRSKIEIVFVDHIPDDRGKRRFIISELEKQILQ